MEIFNGQIYYAPHPLCHTVIVQYLGKPDGDTWILLSSPYETADYKGMAMMLCCYGRKDGLYNPFYTKEELAEKLEDWELIENKGVILSDIQ